MPASDAHETASHAMSAHEQSTVAHSTTCAHTIQSRALHNFTCAHAAPARAPTRRTRPSRGT
eukprot:4893433-Prymnesium_polylepis.1